MRGDERSPVVPEAGGVPPVPSGWTLDHASGLAVPPSAEKLRRKGFRLVSSPDGALKVAVSSSDLDVRMLAFADEEALGHSPSSREDVIKMIAGLPFGPAVLATTHLAAALWHVRTDAHGQLALLAALFGETRFLRSLRAFCADEAHVPLSEQQLLVLLRLVVEHSTDEPVVWPTGYPDAEAFVSGLVGAATLVGAAGSHLVDRPEALDEWLSFLIQNGAYNAHEDPMRLLARAYALFIDIANRPGMRSHDSFCELETWLSEDYGFGALEQMAIGAGALVAARVLDEDAEFRERCRLNRGFFAPSSFGPREDEVLHLLGGSRSSFQEAFAASGATPEHLAWDADPFLRRPFIALDDDNLVLTSPRALWHWLAEGLNYRLVQAAKRRGGGPSVNRYTAFLGALTETWARELIEWALPAPRPPGGGRVFGEIAYGEKRSPDIAVDFGPDLILVEVVSSRLRWPSRVLGYPRTLTHDLERSLTSKMRQLSARTDDILAGRVPGLDIDPTAIERVWPIIVASESFPQSLPFWTRIDRDRDGALSQARVQPVSIFDLTDLENLAALIRDGIGLVGILRRKTAPAFARLDFAAWLSRDPFAPDARICGFVEHYFALAMSESIRVLDLPKS